MTRLFPSIVPGSSAHQVIAAIYDKSLRVKPGAAAAAIPPRKKAPPLSELIFGPSKKKAVTATVKPAILPKAPVKAAAGTAHAKLLSDQPLSSDIGKEIELTSATKGASKPPPAAAAAPAGKRKTTGEIVNLMAVDAQRLQDSMGMLAVIWSGVFQIVLALW